ncbi:MAG TPA: hypothetical protein VF615_07235 [Longimicrobiaceae bacterium]|jgi:hypothetical protein
MPPISTRKTDRKLVLGRETVRALTRPRTMVDQTIVADETSCGEACTCACPAETY